MLNFLPQIETFNILVKSIVIPRLQNNSTESGNDNGYLCKVVEYFIAIKYKFFN
jgi:hypothetical protein